MAIKKVDAVDRSKLRFATEIKLAENRIDEAINTRYVLGETLYFRLSELVSRDASYEILAGKYTDAGWKVRKGWAGTRDDGYSTFELS